jgi:2-dehydropantoate 2-reductase
MKICVVGAGSIGGLLGVKLALAGEDVTLIARGNHLEAIQENGLSIAYGDGRSEVARNVKATHDMRACGPQDLVILGLKAHQIRPVVDEIRSLFGPDTMVLTTQNGLPWWYFQRHGGAFDGYRIETLDPDGRLSEGIEARRIIGCIAYPAATIARPGVIRHIEGTRFPVGELDRTESERVQRVSETLTKAGFKSPVLEDIRSEIWLKAWGNLSFNPISALCHATLVDICQFPPTRELAANMMTEAQTIAEKLGVTFRVPLEKRIDGAEKVGKHKTSMLQDVEAGRALETEALIGAVLELGTLTNTPTPCIGAIYAAVKLLGRTMEAENVFVKAQSMSPPALAAVPLREVPALVGSAAG